MTALIVAVRGGYTEVVKELLKRNPNVNMTDKDGNTALMIAAMEGHTEIVQDLLDADTYVNIPDRVNTFSHSFCFIFLMRFLHDAFLTTNKCVDALYLHLSVIYVCIYLFIFV